VSSHRESTEISANEIPQLRDQWKEKYADMFGSIPLELPPFREVNHEINLVDPDKRIHYCLPKCPEHYHAEPSEKVLRYTTAGWWIPTTARQAVPMLCIPKKNGKLRMVFDLREQNDNTVKDVTPFPDQDNIRHDVAHCAYQTKLDMSEAYGQIHVRPADIPKTAFATVLGTFVSQVMQQGDCNAPSMFQRLMTALFQEQIGRFVHVYLDDVFIYSRTIREHEHHLEVVFSKLREAHMFLSKDKIDLY
jgi:Reverse transcriptase (RNA-dependent DNA polymerase)